MINILRLSKSSSSVILIAGISVVASLIISRIIVILVLIAAHLGISCICNHYDLFLLFRCITLSILIGSSLCRCFCLSRLSFLRCIICTFFT